MKVAISMKRGAWINVLREALAEAEMPGDQMFDFKIDAETNERRSRPVEVGFDNDDMERDGMADVACFVDIYDD